MNNMFDALQNEDSGDEDSNGESKLELEPEPDVEVGEGEHPLQYKYTIWFSKKAWGKQLSSKDYIQNIKRAGTFASVEQFWAHYSHMARPGDISGHCTYHIFKRGIKPLWEDDANKKGGKWTVKLKKGLAARCWENLILAILGEQFMVGDEICGAVLSMKYQQDVLSLWNRTADDSYTNTRIRDTLKRVLNLPPNTIVEYKSHTDCLDFRKAQD